MRLLLTAASTLPFWVSTAFGFADFSGKWVLDLRASNSPHAMLKRLGASWVELWFGGSIQMEATYTQTPQLLTVDRQGFGFRKTDVIRLDNIPEIQQNSLLGDTRFARIGLRAGRNSFQIFLFGPRTRGMLK